MASFDVSMPPAIYPDCPRWFASWARDAEAAGAGGFTWVGRHLASRLGEFVPKDAPDHARRMDQLADFEVDLLDAGDDEISSWLDGHLPGCMDRVPVDARVELAAGFLLALHEDLQTMQFRPRPEV